VVVDFDVVPNRGFQLTGAVEGSAPNLFFRNQTKPAFDQIDPRSAGGSKVEVKTGSFDEPLVNQGGLVRTVVVEDQVDFKLFGNVLVDHLEESLELDRAVSAVTTADDFTGGRVQSREQRGGAVTLVVMGPAFRLSRSHRKQGLGAIQCLDLRLLIDTEHDGPLRRVQIQTHNIADFLDEQGVAREFEGFGPMRFESKRPPNAADGRLAQPARLGHGTRTPMGGVFGNRFQGQGNHSLHIIVPNPAGGSGSRFIQKAVATGFQKPAPPFAHRLPRGFQPGGDRYIAFPGGTRQDDSGPAVLRRRTQRCNSSRSGVDSCGISRV